MNEKTGTLLTTGPLDREEVDEYVLTGEVTSAYLCVYLLCLCPCMDRLCALYVYCMHTHFSRIRPREQVDSAPVEKHASNALEMLVAR